MGTLDFEINYVHNFDALMMKDQIISNNGAQFMFLEIYFEAPESGKIVEFVDMNTNKSLIDYSSKQSLMYVPQLFIADSKLWFAVKFDKNNPGANQEELYKDDSVKCRVRIISDAAIRLFPDDSQKNKV